MLFLAVVGFILMNALGIIFLPRFTVCIWIWYTIGQWGYLANGAPDWMVLPAVILVFSTLAALIWDIFRNISFFEGHQEIF